MSFSRREFGRLALAGIPAAYLIDTPLFGAGLFEAKPNSKFSGVQIGVITYSYRSMTDQSAEATLKYILDGGISGVELMDGPAEMFAGAPKAPPRQGGPGGGAGGPGGGGGGRAAGGRAGGAAAPAAAGAAAAAQPLQPGQPSWNGQPCPAGRGGGGPAGAPPAPRAGGAGAPAPAGAPLAAGAAGADAAARAGAPGGGGGFGRGPAAPEMVAYQEDLKKWRTSVSMDKFKQLKKMFNDAGVTIYAYKSDGLQKNMQTSDAEFDYVFNVAKTLGATHTTMELPGGTDAEAMLKRMAQFAEKHQLYVAYHTHGQGSMTAFDQAFAISKWNKSNVDLGHYVAAGNVGGTPLQFLEKFHDRIASFHLKDRTLPEHCSLTVPFGTGDGMLKELLLTLKKNKWNIPATIELEYPVPPGSDAVQEVRKCVEFAKSVLA
jgi:sugar phosphate isomerase/epimerase